MRLLLPLVAAMGMGAVALLDRGPDPEDVLGRGFPGEVEAAETSGPAPALAGPEPTADASEPLLAARPAGLRPSAPPEPDDEPSETTPPAAVRGLPLDVEVVDAETGRDLHAPWGLGGEGAPTSCGPRAVSVPPATWVTELTWTVPLPDGYVSCDAQDPHGYAGGVCRYARALRAVQPLRREADVTVEVRTADGRPASDVGVSAGVDDTHVEVEDAGAGPLGAVRIRGLPFLRGATWQARAVQACADGTRSVGAEGRLPYFAEEPVVVRLTLPAAPDVAFCGPCVNGLIRLGGCRCGCLRVEDVDHPTGTLSLRVLRRAGAPAAAAYVRLEPEGLPAGRDTRYPILDAGGRVVDPTIPVGRWALHVLEPGLVAFSARFEVREGETTPLDLREPAGGDVEAIVVDEEGRPLPFVTLTLSSECGRTWLDLDGDVQRLDPFTDALGRRTLAHLDPGPVRVDARYGARKATARSIVEEGARTVVRLEVR